MMTSWDEYRPELAGFQTRRHLRRLIVLAGPATSTTVFGHPAGARSSGRASKLPPFQRAPSGDAASYSPRRRQIL